MTSPSHEVFVADATAATALGGSLDAVWEALCDGQTAVRPVTRFSTSNVPYHVAACVEGLESKVHEGENLTCTMARAALDQLRAVPRDTYILWTGLKGNAEFVESRCDSAAVTDAPWLTGRYLNWVGAHLGLPRTRGQEINAACASSTVGLALAANLIATGERSSVLVCAADIVSRFTFMGFSALKALTPTYCRPFDRGRDGLCLGDGAVAVLLTNGDVAERLGIDPKVRITGWGSANDATHITGPARDGSGLARAMELALRRAKLRPTDVEALCTHGTGTRFNDSMEMAALETVFGRHHFPLFSIKGALGHTLGAAGALEAAISSRALQQRLVPPTVGLRRADPRVEKRVRVVPQEFPGSIIMSSNSGFGGINACLIMEAR